MHHLFPLWSEPLPNFLCLLSCMLDFFNTQKSFMVLLYILQCYKTIIRLLTWVSGWFRSLVFRHLLPGDPYRGYHISSHHSLAALGFQSAWEATGQQCTCSLFLWTSIQTATHFFDAFQSTPLSYFALFFSLASSILYYQRDSQFLSAGLWCDNPGCSNEVKQWLSFTENTY